MKFLCFVWEQKKSILGWREFMFVHNKGPHLLQREIITESKKYIQEIGKSSSGLHSQFYDIFICNHSFAQMYSLICTGFSGERCGPWASCYMSVGYQFIINFLFYFPLGVKHVLDWINVLLHFKIPYFLLYFDFQTSQCNFTVLLVFPCGMGIVLFICLLPEIIYYKFDWNCFWRSQI